MKTKDYISALKAKDAKGLGDELTSLRREQFNLRMQAAVGQGASAHLVRAVRKNIARLKTVMVQTQTKA